MLNIQKIFEAQDRLDKKVVEVHGLEGKNLTGDVTQALYTELGELSNEIGFFKYWKKNKRDDKARKHDEWADCMHFMASLGNKYGHSAEIVEVIDINNIYNTLEHVEKNSYHLLFEIIYKANFNKFDDYCLSLAALIRIGLRFMTFEDMRDAYFAKNQVNYDRLANGY